MRENTTPRGVKTRLIGIVVLFAAMMDAMLHWRGGFVLGPSTMLLLAAGIALFTIGALRGGRQHIQTRENKR